MKTITIAAFALSLTLLCSGPLLAQSGNDLYQQALVKERAEGDVQGAIELYQRIAREFAEDRPLAAKALVQMGLCYEKLGLTEARQAYQQVIDGFPEQQGEVAVARERLALLAQALAELEPRPTFRKIEIASKPQNGALSPDGETLAFISGGALWVLPVHGRAGPDVAGEPVRLTESIGAWDNASQLTWSADGKWIAFNGESGGGEEGRPNVVHVVSSEDGAMRTVHVPDRRGAGAYGFALALSPGGESLAYSAPGPDELEGDSAAVELRNIFSSPIGGGEPRRLASDWGYTPAYSPDGERVLFVRLTLQNEGGSGNDEADRILSELLVIPSAGGLPVQVTEVRGYARGPVWSPDGRWIAFKKMPGQGDSNGAVWVVPVSEDGAATSAPIEIKLPLSNTHLLAGWTARNELGILLDNPRSDAVYTVPASGGRAVQVTPNGGAFFRPRWLPDGSRLLSTGGGTGIFQLISAEGGEINPVSIPSGSRVRSGFPGTGMGVSPDGRTVVFTGWESGLSPASTLGIWTVPVEGGEPTWHTRTPSEGPWYEDKYPCWSPDGEQVAFVRLREISEGNYLFNLYVIPSAGGEATRLTTDSDGVASASIAYSPDGESIAFFSDGALKLKPVGGGEARVVTEVPDVNRWTDLSWSPDGNSIAYTRIGSIWVVSIDGGDPVEVRTGFLTKNSQNLMIAWSPDGERIAFSESHGGEAELWLISDFLGEGR